MITLYHRPNTRATRFIFLLEELEAPYEIRSVTTRTRDGGGAPDPANPHPHGKVPAISDATSFALFANSPILPKSTVLEDYVKRVVSRPAFARAMAKQNG